VGEALTEEILRGIDSCYWFVPILSPNALDSEWTSLELAAAKAKGAASTAGAHILPVLYRDCEVPEALDNLAHADFRYSYEEGLQSLIDALNAPVKARIEASLLSEDEQKIRSAWLRVGEGARPLYTNRLMDKLEGPEAGERCAALTALWQLRRRDALPQVERCLRDPSPAVLRRAIAFAGESQQRSLAPVIAGLASHSDPGVREAARQAHRRLTGARP
jgi:hypothetical protein